MKVYIRLLKAWKNGETEWPENQVLGLNQPDADYLMTQEIAEKYAPKAGDIISVSEVQDDSGMSKAELIDLVNEVLSKNSQFRQHQEEEEDPILKTGGFRSIGHFAMECRKAQLNESDKTELMVDWLKTCKETKAPSGMNEGIDADGGFLVPTQFRNTLLRNAVEATVFYPRTTKIPMQTNTVEIPAVIESTRASSIYGGIIVYRPAEGASITASNPKMGRVKLQLSKLAALAYVTTELLEDSPISIEPLLGTMFGEAIGFQVDEDIVNGTGVNQARGILNSKSLISVTGETDQEADTIVTNNVIKMYSRLRPRSQRSAIWSANNDCFPQLATLQFEVGTGGSSAGLLQMGTNGVTGEPIMTLLGRPLFLTEHNQTLGDKGDILLADMKQYLVGEKSGGQIRAASSIHLKFDQDEIAFRFIVRLDGQAWEASALTPKHSSTTLSSFVTLAART